MVMSDCGGALNSFVHLEMRENDFAYIQSVVYQKSGIHLKDNKRTMVANRLRRRIVDLGLSSFADYCAILGNGNGSQEEFEVLLNCITTNETFFFREIHHFDYLRKKLFPEIAASPGRIFNAWCAGCSTGQEPYSIAIAALDYMEETGSKFSVMITAGDISTRVLGKAAEGFYEEGSLKGLSPTQIKKYFTREESGYRISKQVRNLVAFKKMNLLHDHPVSPQNVVFCRNVMIYFDSEARKKLVTNLKNSLRNEGALIIGTSETIHGLDDGLEVEKLNGSYVYRKQVATRND